MTSDTTPQLTEALAVRPEKAAELLDVSRSTVYNLMARGELVSFMVGSARRITRRSIDDYMGRHQVRQVTS